MTKHAGGRPPKYETEEQLINTIQEYFDKCVDTPLTITNEDGEEYALTTKAGKPVLIPNPPTTAGLAFHLGYASRQSLYDLKKKDEFSYTIKRAVLLIEDYHEKSIAIGENCTGSIFWLKNHDWRDKHEIDFKDVKQPDMSRYSKQELKQLAELNRKSRS